jgi:hypothetical protein
MTASFPRNWDYPAVSNNGPAPNIVLPGIVGVVHVVTAVAVSLFIGGGATTLCQVELVETPGINYVLGQIYATSGTDDVYTVDWSGSIAAPLGSQVNIEVQIISGGGNFDWTSEVQGYDY